VLGLAPDWQAGSEAFQLAGARCAVRYQAASILSPAPAAQTADHTLTLLPLPPCHWPQEVVVGFHKAPKRWWDACTSQKGKQNLYRWGRGGQAAE